MQDLLPLQDMPESEHHSFLDEEIDPEDILPSASKAFDVDNPRTAALISVLKNACFADARELVLNGAVTAKMALYFTIIIGKTNEAYNEIFSACKQNPGTLEIERYADFGRVEDPFSEEMEELRSAAFEECIATKDKRLLEHMMKEDIGLEFTGSELEQLAQINNSLLKSAHQHHVRYARKTMKQKGTFDDFHSRWKLGVSRTRAVAALPEAKTADADIVRAADVL